MKKYRCTNCNHTWEAQEEPFECPKCHSASIVSDSEGGSVASGFKKYWWIIVCGLVVAALAVFLLMPRNTISVRVDADKENNTLKVMLAGKHAGEYIIRLNGGERSFATSADVTEVTFDELVGDYVIDLIYMGTGEAPKVRDFEKNYTFENRVEVATSIDDAETMSPTDMDSKMGRVTNKPEIKKVVPSPSRISKGESYKVTVQLSQQGCTVAEAQFKLDDGEWQGSNVFTGLQPGKHVIYARNASSQQLTSSTEIFLEEAGAGKCLSADDANKLLKRISEYDDEAVSQMRKYVGNATPVTGGDTDDHISNAQDLITFTSGTLKYRVVSVQCNGKKIESITIAKM